MFFCDEVGDSSELHSVSTFDVEVRNRAHLLNDGKLLAKLYAGDLIAMEAKYQTKCLVALYNRARQSEAALTEKDAYRSTEAMAFADLIAYLDYCKESQQQRNWAWKAEE